MQKQWSNPAPAVLPLKRAGKRKVETNRQPKDRHHTKIFDPRSVYFCLSISPFTSQPRHKGRPVKSAGTPRSDRASRRRRNAHPTDEQRATRCTRLSKQNNIEFDQSINRSIDQLIDRPLFMLPHDRLILHQCWIDWIHQSSACTSQPPRPLRPTHASDRSSRRRYSPACTYAAPPSQAHPTHPTHPHRRTHGETMLRLSSLGGRAVLRAGKSVSNSLLCVCIIHPSSMRRAFVCLFHQIAAPLHRSIDRSRRHQQPSAGVHAIQFINPPIDPSIHPSTANATTNRINPTPLRRRQQRQQGRAAPRPPPAPGLGPYGDAGQQALRPCGGKGRGGHHPHRRPGEDEHHRRRLPRGD